MLWTSIPLSDKRMAFAIRLKYACNSIYDVQYQYSRSWKLEIRLNLVWSLKDTLLHYDDVKMGAMTSHITSLTIVYATVYSDADQRKHQSPASLAFVLGIHRGPVNSPHKWPVTPKMFPFHDVIMKICKGTRVFFHSTLKKVDSIILLICWVKQWSDRMVCTSVSKHLQNLWNWPNVYSVTKIIIVPLKILAV